MQTHTSSEFEELMIIMDNEYDERDVWMHYMAQIAMEVAQSRSKKSLRLEDFFIKFKREVPKNVELTEEEKTTRLQNSKNYWLGLTARAKKPPPQKKKVVTPPPTRTPIRKRR